MINNVNKVIVCNVEAANTGTSLQTIAEGDVLILNEAGAVLTGTPTPITNANDSQIIIMGKTNGDVKKSNMIKLRNITSVQVKDYQAAVQEVVQFGYDGATGVLPTPDASTEYQILIPIKDDQRFLPNRPTRQWYDFTTSSAPTALELAQGLVQQVQLDAGSVIINGYVSAVLLTNGTFTALTNPAAVNQYNNTVISTAHGLLKGDFVRIGGTGDTNPVYKVKAVVDANTFQIEGSYMGASGTILAANIGKMTAITIVGIKLVALVIPKTKTSLDLYQTVQFAASIIKIIDTTNTLWLDGTISTNSFPGQGVWQQVKDVEYFAQGYEGITNRVSFPTAQQFGYNFDVVVGNTYNSVLINYYGEGETDFQRTGKYPESVEIFFYSASAPTHSTKETNFLATIESLAEFFGNFVQ